MEEKLMAKTQKLLLTSFAAIICLVALLLGIMLPTSTPAQAADSYSYLEQSGVGISGNQDSQILLVAISNGKNYAINATGPFALSAAEVTVVNGEVTSTVTDSMLWTVEKNGNYYAYRNVSYNNYLSSSGPSMSGNSSATGCTFYSGSDLQGDNDKYIYLSGTSLSTTGSYSSAITWKAYKKTLNLDNPTTISFAKGDDKASGTMENVLVEQNSSYTLPTCKFTLSLYAFDGWNVQIGDGAVEKKNVGDEITVTADTTLTACWAENYWVVTFTTADTILADQGLPDATLKIEKEKSDNLGKLADRWEGVTDPDQWIFDGWALADTKEKVNSYYKPTQDTTLIPVFVEGVKIVYDFNGGVAPTSSYTAFKNDKKKPTESYSLYTHYASYESSKMPTREGYVFLGWTCNNGKEYLADLTNTNSQYKSYKLNEEFVKDGSQLEEITFTAKWQFDGFTLTFKVDDQEYAIKTHAKVTGSSGYKFYFEAEGVAIPEAPAGKVFKQWTTSSRYNDQSGKYSVYHSSSGHYADCYITLPNESSSVYWEVLNYNVEIVAVFEDAPIVCTVNFKYENDETPYATATKNITGSSTSCSISLDSSYFGTAPDGQAFLKWVDEDNNVYNTADKTSVSFSKTEGKYTKTLTVYYATAVTISFDLNGGNYTGDAYNNKQCGVGNIQKMPSYDVPTKTNYTLTGWKCGDIVVEKGATYEVAGVDMTFVAQWKYDGYTLIFQVDGTEDQTILVEKTEDRYWEENTTYTIAVSDPVVEGKVFLGWILDGNTEKLWKKGDTLTTAQLKALTDREGTFVASFRDKATYIVTLHYGNETKELSFVEGQTNIQFNIDMFNANFQLENEQSTFNGWYKDQAFTQAMSKSYVTAGQGDLIANMDLYAKVDEKVTVTFNFGIDGVEPRTSTLPKDPGVSVPYPYPNSELPEKTGYTLIGWSKTEGGEIAYNAEANVYVQENCTLYAVWSYNYYVITLTNGLSGNAEVTAEITVLKPDVYLGSDKYTLDNILSRKNGTGEDAVTYGSLFAVEHKTLTWKDSEGNTVRTDEDIANNGDKTYTATYTDIRYTITFEENGGDPVDDISAIYGATITLPTPRKEGFVFIGWMDRLGQKFTATTMPGENITLTAGWQQAHTISFNANGGEPVQSISLMEGEAITLPTPTKANYVFVKWQKDGADFTATTMPAEDVELTAVWAVDAELFATKLAAINSATTLEAKRAAIKDADALLAIWTSAHDDTSALNTTALTAAKTAYNALASSAESDLAVAEKLGVSLVATLAAVVPLAAVALILKRRMF